MRRKQASKPGPVPSGPLARSQTIAAWKLGNRSRILGIGTFVTVLGLIGVAVAGRWHDTRPIDPRMGRVVYQADATGKLQRIDPLGQRSVSAAPFWKPEAGFLVAHAAQLDLSAAQKHKVAQQDALWTSEKQSLVQAMRESSDGLAPASGGPAQHAVTVGRLGNVLQDYSALSIQYDRRRRHYWTLAISSLNDAQRATLVQIEAAPRGIPPAPGNRAKD